MEFLHTTAEGVETWTNVAAVPVMDEQRTITGAVAIVLGIDAIKRGTETLRAREEQLRIIVESARDYAIFTTDKDDVIDRWLPGAENVFGWTKEEAEGQPAAILFTPEDREKDEPRKEIETARIEGSAPDVRWHIRKTGERVFIEGQVVPLRDQAGEVQGFLKIGRDATESRRAAELQNSLLSELQHRVRNTLGVVRSIARRTADNSTSAQDMLSHFQGRLDAFARVQAAITRTAGATVDLASLIEDEMVAHAAKEGEHLRIDGPEVMLDENRRAAQSGNTRAHDQRREAWRPQRARRPHLDHLADRSACPRAPADARMAGTRREDRCDHAQEGRVRHGIAVPVAAI